MSIPLPARVGAAPSIAVPVAVGQLLAHQVLAVAAAALVTWALPGSGWGAGVPAIGLVVGAWFGARHLRGRGVSLDLPTVRRLCARAAWVHGLVAGAAFVALHLSVPDGLGWPELAPVGAVIAGGGGFAGLVLTLCGISVAR